MFGLHRLLASLSVLVGLSACLSCGWDSTSIGSKLDRHDLSSYHPEIEGFTYLDGFDERQYSSDNKSGYIYYDLDLYWAQFTQKSKLIIAHVTADFTPGYVANLNEKTFDSGYKLTLGYIHIGASKIVRSTYWSSDVYYLAGWPYSSKESYAVSSTTGLEITFGKESSKSHNLNGAVLSKSTKKNSLTLKIEKTASASGDNPKLSSQQAPNNQLEHQLSYEYKVAGTNTLNQDCYLLFECVDNATGPFNPASFKIDVDIKMNTTKKTLGIFTSKKSVSANCAFEYGIND